MGYSANISPHGSEVPNQKHLVCVTKGSQIKTLETYLGRWVLVYYLFLPQTVSRPQIRN